MFSRLAPAALLALVITTAGGHPGFAAEDTVVATVNGHIKGEKLDVIKFRRRKGYRRKTGFRGKYLSITVKEISG